jgi:hypothetical protein
MDVTKAIACGRGQLTSLSELSQLLGKEVLGKCPPLILITRMQEHKQSSTVTMVSLSL